MSSNDQDRIVEGDEVAAHGCTMHAQPQEEDADPDGHGFKLHVQPLPEDREAR
jgi:hypothetical protein